MQTESNATQVPVADELLIRRTETLADAVKYVVNEKTYLIDEKTGDKRPRMYFEDVKMQFHRIQRDLAEGNGKKPEFTGEEMWKLLCDLSNEEHSPEKRASIVIGHLLKWRMNKEQIVVVVERLIQMAWRAQIAAQAQA
jgi:hypothetical protein